MSQKYSFAIGASLLVIALADIVLTAFGFDLAVFSPQYDQFEFGLMLALGFAIGIKLVLAFDTIGKTPEDKIKLRRSQMILRSLMLPCFAMLAYCFVEYRFDFEQMTQSILGVAGFWLGYFTAIFIMSECVLD
ncbi:MAG: hypothetical protein IJ824_03900, partial [Alphaproteobacteria bacterium]|nr:hypothetical protein [Alphaproteobacteria bacterium]